MVWGKSASTGVEDLVKRLQSNDPVLRSLTVLRFRRLNDEDVAQLSRAIQENQILQELNCSSHAISKEAAAVLGSMLQHNRCLQRVSIGNSTFGDEALAALVSGGLHKNQTLSVWDLEHKGLSQVSAVRVAQVLQQHPTLKQLQLSRNSLLDAGVQHLCAEPWATLQHLEIAACGLTHQGVAALASAPSICQLQQLDLSHNNLGPDAAPSLAQLLAKATQLQVLKLGSAKLQDAGLQGIADGLQHVPSLTLIDLSSNQLSSSGLEALAAGLACRPTGAAIAAVQHVILADNPGIQDSAVCKLAESLKASNALMPARAGASQQESDQQVDHQQQQHQQQQRQLKVDLGLSGVGADGIAALANVAGLTHLSLFGCKLGEEQSAACTALVDSINSGGFTALKELNITGCGLSLAQLTTIMHTIAAGGRCLPDLQTLELGANSGVQEDGFEQLVAMLRTARPGLDVHWRVADSDSLPS